MGPEQGLGLRTKLPSLRLVWTWPWCTWALLAPALHSSPTGRPKGLGTPLPLLPTSPALPGCPPVMGPSSGVQEEALGLPGVSSLRDRHRRGFLRALALWTIQPRAGQKYNSCVCVFITHFLLFNVRRSGKTLSCPGGLHLQFPLTRRDGVLGRSTRGQGFVQPVCVGTGDRVNGQEP